MKSPNIERMIIAVLVTLLICASGMAHRIHQSHITKADTDIKRVRGAQFELLENEFTALQNVLAVETSPEATQLIRSRMVICLEIMNRLVAQGILVRRERPCDGFEEYKGIPEWTKRYEDTTSKFPEWSTREYLVNSIFAKQSG